MVRLAACFMRTCHHPFLLQGDVTDFVQASRCPTYPLNLSDASRPRDSMEGKTSGEDVLQRGHETT